MKKNLKKLLSYYKPYKLLFFIDLFFAIVGARLYYVIFSWDYYKDNLLSILNLRQGGLAIYGGIIAGAITLLIFAKKTIIRFFCDKSLTIIRIVNIYTSTIG